VAAKNLVVPVPIEVTRYFTFFQMQLVLVDQTEMQKECSCKDIETERVQNKEEYETVHEAVWESFFLHL